MTPRWTGWADRRRPVGADRRRRLPGRAREVVADPRPVQAAVRGLPQRIGREEQRARIDRRKQQRRRPERARVRITRRPDVLDLAGPAIEARHLAAVHQIGIERIRRDVAVLLHTDGQPLAERDLSVVAAAGDARRPALLLPAAHAVRERVVRAHVVELRGRLVVPGTPALAAVHRHDGALIGGQDHHVRPRGVDPDLLVVVAARRAANGGERPAAVGGLPRHNRRHVHDVRIRGVHAHVGGIVRPRDDARVCVHPRPGLAGIIGSIDAGKRAGLDRREQPVATGRRDGDADSPQSLPKRRQALRQRPPRRAAVDRLEQAAPGPGPHAVFPRALARFPEHGVNDVRVHWIEGDVDAARVLVPVQHLLERASAVDRPEDAALGVRAVGMAQHRHEQPVRDSPDPPRSAESAARRAIRDEPRCGRRRSICRCRRRSTGPAVACLRRCRRR